MPSSKSAKRRRKVLQRKRREKLSASIAPVSEESTFSLQATASFDQSSLEAKDGEEKTPRFSLSAYNGGAMRPSGFRYPVVVDLTGVAHESTTPIFLDHEVSGKGLVGHSSVAIDTGTITADGLVSADTEAARTVVESAKKGFPWQVSIGATVDEKEFVKSGESRKVNGQIHAGPFYHVKKSHMHEVSFVPIGADKTTSAAIAAKERSQKMAEDTATKGDKTQDDDTPKLEAGFVKWCAVQGVDVHSESEENVHTLELAYNMVKTQKDIEFESLTPDDQVNASRESMVAEINRQEEIKKICKHDAELCAKAISEGWSTIQTELQLLRDASKKVPQSMGPSSFSREIDSDVMACALCLDAKLEPEWLDKKNSHWGGARSPACYPNMFQGFDEKTIDAAQSAGQYSFGRLFHEFLYANGVSVPPGCTTQELIPYVNATHQKIKASTGFSTVSIDGILSNVMGKSMLAMFESVDGVAQRISANRSVRDFKESKAFRLAGNGDFLPVGPTGELQSMGLQEEEYANRAQTFGRIISVSREMLINDDLGALTAITRVLGRKAALKLQQEFFKLFVTLESSSFFSVANGNLIADVLAIDGLTAGETLFRKQRDADGDPISVSPSILLVPDELVVTAQVHMNDTTTMVWDRDTSATETNQWPRMNPHVGKWNIENSPWLTMFGEADEATAWWLLADPQILSCMEIVYLNGRTTPYIESDDASFDVLGFQWRSYYDFGVSQQDFRGGVKSQGDGTGP